MTDLTHDLTVEKVRAEVERITAIAGDDECAHSAEDDLHQAVLTAIARGEGPAQELAAEALKTLHVDFERWCA